jgi:hypothetical protein
MAAVYKKYKEQILQSGANTNLASGTVKAVFVSSAYTYSDTHQYKSSLTGIMQSGGSDATITIGNKVLTSGTFKTTDNTATLTAVTASATTYNAIVLYVDTGVAGTSPLVAYINGVSVTPNGGNITIDWDDVSTLNGVTGNVIFAL